MKIAFICDMHLPDLKKSVQHKYFEKALDHIKKSNCDMVVTVGDISAFGETSAIDYYKKSMEGLSFVSILGNSDARSGLIDEAGFGGSFVAGKRKNIQRRIRRIICIIS